MKKIYLSLFVSFLTVIFYGQCSHQFNMYDSFGDGWNGNTWTATSINNPANSFSFTLNTGSSGSSSFCLPNDCYNVECNGGSWQSEVSWDLVETTIGNTLLSGGAPFSQLQYPIGTSTCSNNPTLEVLHWYILFLFL